MAGGNEEKELVRWFAEVFIREVDFQKGKSCCITFDPASPFKIMGEDSCWIVFLQPKNLDASEVLPEIKYEGYKLEARLFRSNSRFTIVGELIDRDMLIKMKLSHTKLRVGLKDGTDDILRMDVI